MAQPQSTIPDKYKNKLRLVEPKDTRSDAEIIESLTQHVPITSEKNIWSYWHAGVQAMPSWCKRNVANWARIHGSDWTIRILDTVPGSPNHALKWIDSGMLPEAFVKGTMKGPYTGPHSADFLRGAALYTYGGCWMDVGNMLFRNLDRVCWDQLADENSPYTVSTPWMFEQYTANHFVASRKGDIFIKKWHDLFMHLWKGQDEFTDIIQNPLLAFVKDFKFAEGHARGFKWEFQVDEATLLGYITQVVAWIRLTWVQEPGPNGFNGLEYWCKKVLLFDVAQEDWSAEFIVGFDGIDLFNVFTTRLDADPSSPEYQAAEKVTWRLLSQSTMQKITHGKELCQSIQCGAFLDMPENEGRDASPGTFGELLRYGATHFEQTRRVISYVEAPRPADKDVIHKGIYEP